MEYGTSSHNYETGTLTIDLFMPEEMYEDGVLGKVCGVTVCGGMVCGGAVCGGTVCERDGVWRDGCGRDGV